MGGQKWLRRPPSLAAGVSYPFRTSARNDALLYMACAMYSCVLRSCRLGSLVWPRPWAACVALLRPRGVAPCAALRLFPRYGKVTFPLLVMRSIEPRRQACSPDAKRMVRGLGKPQQAYRDVQKDIPMPCLPTL